MDKKKKKAPLKLKIDWNVESAQTPDHDVPKNGVDKGQEAVLNDTSLQESNTDRGNKRKTQKSSD